jgi:hypothetical protein
MVVVTIGTMRLFISGLITGENEYEWIVKVETIINTEANATSGTKLLIDTWEIVTPKVNRDKTLYGPIESTSATAAPGTRVIGPPGTSGATAMTSTLAPPGGRLRRESEVAGGVANVSAVAGDTAIRPLPEMAVAGTTEMSDMAIPEVKVVVPSETTALYIFIWTDPTGTPKVNDDNTIPGFTIVVSTLVVTGTRVIGLLDTSGGKARVSVPAEVTGRLRRESEIAGLVARTSAEAIKTTETADPGTTMGTIEAAGTTVARATRFADPIR